MVLGSICKCFHHCQCHTPYFSANFFGVVLVSFFVLLLACWAGCFLHLMTLFWTLEGLLKSPSSSSLGGIITRPLAFGKDRGKTETVPQGDFLADAKKNFPCFFGLSFWDEEASRPLPSLLLWPFPPQRLLVGLHIWILHEAFASENYLLLPEKNIFALSRASPSIIRE